TPDDEPEGLLGIGTPRTALDDLRRRPCALFGPRIHQRTPLLQQIRPRVRRFGLVLDGVGQRRLDDLSTFRSRLPGPIPESGSKSVWNHRSAFCVTPAWGSAILTAFIHPTHDFGQRHVG